MKIMSKIYRESCKGAGLSPNPNPTLISVKYNLCNGDTMKRQNNREESESVRHSIPAVFVEVPDIGLGVPGIQIFCNKTSHGECLEELRKAIKSGGRVVQRSQAWHDLCKKFENEDKFNARHKI